IVITLRTAVGVPVQSVPLRSEKTDSPGLPSSGGGDLPSAPVPFDVTGNLFSLSGIFHTTWLLSVESGGAIIGKIPLDGSVKQFRGGGIEVFLDSAGPVSGLSEADILKLRRLDGIASFYRILLPIAAILSLGLYFFASFRTVKRRRITVAWIISTALVVSIMARLVILSLVHVTSFPAVYPRYLSPAYPLLLLFIVVSLVDGTATMRGRDGSKWSRRG
ncbi:MAG TPA: hypothetical protein VN260_06295, partial [Dissulfurispiraceae bacterium]|nr:hypothetical protein [Dissulfurispiraceae bacterium]